MQFSHKPLELSYLAVKLTSSGKSRKFFPSRFVSIVEAKPFINYLLHSLSITFLIIANKAIIF